MNQQKFCKKKKNPQGNNKQGFKLKYKQHKIDMQQNTPLNNLCKRCFDIIKWKLDFGQYKKLKQPGKCSVCQYKTVLKAYRNICDVCATEKHICTKCSKPTEEFVEDINKKDKFENEKLIAMKNILKKLRECSRRKIDRLLEQDMVVFKDDKFYYRDTMEEVEVQLKKKFRECDVDMDNLDDLDEFLNGPIDDSDESASYKEDDQLIKYILKQLILYIFIQFSFYVRQCINPLMFLFFGNLNVQEKIFTILMQKDDCEYKKEIDEVLDKKTRDNKTYYLIQWKGLKSKYNSWEKRENVLSINSQKINNFEEKLLKMHQPYNSKNPEEQDEQFDQQKSGSFKYGDIPIKIQFLNYIRSVDASKEINCTVRWKKRINGYQPEDSICSNAILKRKCPELLIDYYESKIKGLNQ